MEINSLKEQVLSMQESVKHLMDDLNKSKILLKISYLYSWGGKKASSFLCSDTERQYQSVLPCETSYWFISSISNEKVFKKSRLCSISVCTKEWTSNFTRAILTKLRWWRIKIIPFWLRFSSRFNLGYSILRSKAIYLISIRWWKCLHLCIWLNWSWKNFHNGRSTLRKHYAWSLI